MHIKSILNRVEKHPGFIYGKVEWIKSLDNGECLEVEIRPRVKHPPTCSKCHNPRPGYDTLPVRRFAFVPLWGILVYFRYAMRRVNCPECGVVVEEVPWVNGKHHVTKTYAWFLANWARRLSWSEVATVFRTSWQTVFHAVEMAVAWGREHQDLTGITAIGVDEILWQRGNKFLTLVYQINAECKRLLWVGRDRKVKTLLRYFHWFGKERSRLLEFVCSDMWRPYLKVIAKKANQAIHVLDRFHIVSHLSKAIDEVRAQEARSLLDRGKEPVLKRTRWCLLKRPENLTDKQRVTLKELLQCNLRTVRAYLLKEEFDFFWDYQSPYWAGRFLDEWCTKVLKSRMEPMAKVARMIRNHRDLILNWFRARGEISSGVVEGFNNKAKLITRRAYGFRSFEVAEMALYHALGKLPEPAFTHKFW